LCPPVWMDKLWIIWVVSISMDNVTDDDMAQKEQYTSDMLVRNSAMVVGQLEAEKTTASFENIRNFYEKLSAKGDSNVNIINRPRSFST
jgi:hypothetical protein